MKGLKGIPTPATSICSSSRYAPEHKAADAVEETTELVQQLVRGKSAGGDVGLLSLAALRLKEMEMF
jgi:hypothetical protein